MDNHIEIEGRVGNDPDLTFLGAKNSAFCEIRIGHTERRKNPTTNEWESGETMWIPAKFWGRAAEKAAEIPKGALVQVSGKLVQEKWTNAEGEERSRFKILCLHPPQIVVTSAEVESGSGYITLKWGAGRSTAGLRKTEGPVAGKGEASFQLQDLYPADDQSPF